MNVNFDPRFRELGALIMGQPRVEQVNQPPEPWTVDGGKIPPAVAERAANSVPSDSGPLFLNKATSGNYYTNGIGAFEFKKNFVV